MKQSSLSYLYKSITSTTAVAQERLPTNTTTHNHPVHRWFNFIAGFSPEFVSNCIQTLPNYRNLALLDPFTGCGTTQVEGLFHGMNVVGYEPHPIFFKIANAKTQMRSKNLGEIEAIIHHGLRNPVDSKILGEKPYEFLAKLFSPDTLSRLVGARIAIQNSPYAIDDLAFLVLSKVLDNASHSQTDGIYKAPTSIKRSHDVEDALLCITKMIADDREYIGSRSTSNCKIVPTSSENMSDVQSESIDIIITSPPYINNFDYAEMTRMYLYFWGIANTWGEITDLVRAKLILNTTTALKGHKEIQIQDRYRNRLPDSIQRDLLPIVEKLRLARKIKAGKKEYDFLIYPYFSQMMSVIRECRRTLKSGGTFHMMVADAALYGTHIPAPQILAQILLDCGFANVRCDQVRKRGHRWTLDKREGSEIGLGEYHIQARRF
ncbi:MAG: DNA methylase [Magnetococcales bacterium]|nr:DNA methylase [Magnetococcales bacterium]